MSNSRYWRGKAALRASSASRFFTSPGGCAPPDALRLLLPRGKSNQKRARTNGSGLLSRGRPWAATSAGEERTVRRGFWLGEASELAVLLLPLWYL